jgi:DamX protein
MNTGHPAATTVPPYIAYYGMTRDPFTPIIEDDLFYSEPTRKQRLNILLHLTQYGNELMLVTGPSGSGKSTLLWQFRHKMLDTWSVACIKARNGIDDRKLLQQLYHQLGMEFHGATHSELLEQLQHHFDALQRNARQAVMLVDDADRLPVTALRQILEMAALSNADHKPLLRIILLGSTTLENKLNDPLLGHHANLPRRNLELPPFDEEHSTHYILHRLTTAHFVASEPFTDDTLHKLYKQSGGWPGRLNNLAHKLLMDSLPVSPQETLDQLDTRGSFHPVRALVALSVTLIIGALLVFQGDINAWLNPQPAIETADTRATLPATTEQPTTAGAIPQPTIPDEPTPTPPAPSATPTDTLPAIPPANRPILASTVPITPTLPAQLTDSDTSTAEPARIVLPEDATPTPPATTNDTPPPSAVTQPIDGHGLPELQDDWLLQQDSTHYTLQLIAGTRLNTLRRFIRQHRLTDKLALYHTTRKDQPWFGLTYGIYPDKQQAIKARARLPHSLRRSPPWIRNLNGIHTDIRKNRP